MKLVLDKQATGSRRKGRLQERFDKLMGMLERQRRRDDRFRQTLDELVDIYHRRSMENDKLLLDDLAALSSKLIAFAGRKSLSRWHRVELDDWLRDLIERRIGRVDEGVAARLRVEYQQAIARSLDIPVEEMLERFEAEAEDFEEQAEQANGAREAEQTDGDPWQEDLFGFDDIDFETETCEGDPDPSEPDWMREEKDAPASGTVMDGTWAIDLFRRAAQALHPDREPDPERRLVKQERMRELLRARKHGDIMAMLTIYSENVTGADVVVAEDTMAEICDALEQQLNALEVEKQAYVYSHPVRHMVFDLFYHSSKKERARRLREWEKEYAGEPTELRALIGFLRNLTCLKSVLEDRCEERSAMIAEVLFEDMRV